MSGRTVGAASARLSFTKLWRLRGQPTLRIIKPIATWTLPAGVLYDANQDQFVDTQGVPQTVSYATQPATVVGFLVNQGRKSVELAIPGMVTTDTIDVTVLWSAAVQTQIQTCWGVVIDNRLYRVSSWEPMPLGTPTPTEIRITLSEGA